MNLKLSKNVIKDYARYLGKILIIGIMIFFINKFLFQLCFIKGDSMSPTLKNGQVIIVKKFKLDFQYGDIVIIKKNDKIIVKRLVGLPNDRIKIDGYLYVNDTKMDGYYIEDRGEIINEINLRENEYFVLGDNINNSVDSRNHEIGIIYRDEIIGKKIFNSRK